MAKIVGITLRALQFFMALVIMAIIGNAIAMGADSAINNYTMFCAAIGMLFLFFLIPATIKEEWAVMPALPFALDTLLVIFWFCGAVALAAELGVHSCGNDSYVSTNHVIRGASDQHAACREAQASCAFLWFGWACFVGSMAMSAMGLRGGGSPRGGVRRSGPAMSQV